MQMGCFSSKPIRRKNIISISQNLTFEEKKAIKEHVELYETHHKRRSLEYQGTPTQIRDATRI